MIRTLLIATLCLSSTIVSVSATNIPYTPSLTKGTSRAQIPRALLEEKEDSQDRGGDGCKPHCKDDSFCWCVLLSIIILITITASLDLD